MMKEMVVTSSSWDYLKIVLDIKKNADSLEYLDLTSCTQTNDELIKEIAPHM